VKKNGAVVAMPVGCSNVMPRGKESLNFVSLHQPEISATV
jgi:hypothetical protein